MYVWHVTVVSAEELRRSDSPLPAIEFDAEHSDPETLRAATNSVLREGYIVHSISLKEDT
jgi:hypothetical protein